MPHSLYLGSGIVQARLTAFDVKTGFYTPHQAPPSGGKGRFSIFSVKEQPTNDTIPRIDGEEPYRPSLAAINHCLKYSTIELCISLCTFALFVNSAILIVSGASLSGTPGADDADIFGIHSLLSSTLSPAAGVIFALALLLSGISAGVVCTIAGQMVSEGALNWTMAPWARRLITRSISITPSIIIAGAVGRSGLSSALNGTQVVLSVVLPFVTAPLIWFTARGAYMRVKSSSDAAGVQRARPRRGMMDFSGQETNAPPGAHRNGSSEEAREASEGTNTTVVNNESPSGILQRQSSSTLSASANVESSAPRNNKDGGGNEGGDGGVVQMRNHWITTAFAVVIWLLITGLNVANLALLKNE